MNLQGFGVLRQALWYFGIAVAGFFGILAAILLVCGVGWGLVLCIFGEWMGGIALAGGCVFVTCLIMALVGMWE